MAYEDKIFYFQYLTYIPGKTVQKCHLTSITEVYKLRAKAVCAPHAALRG